MIDLLHNTNIEIQYDLFKDIERIEESKKIPLNKETVQSIIPEIVYNIPNKLSNIVVEDIEENLPFMYEGNVVEFNPACYEYQKEGIKFGVTHNRFILGDDMGLGKTLQILEICRIRGFKRILILCPKRVLNTWRNEVNKWYSKTVSVLSGDQTERFNMLMDHDKPYMVCTYETYRQMEDEFDMLEMLPGKKFDCIVCDEAHKIKNRDSKICRRLIHIAVKDKLRPFILATGTPVMNKYEEIWPYLKIIWPDYFSSYHEFLESWFECEYSYVGNSRQVKKAKRLKSPIAFQKMLNNFMIRRLRDDVMDLPEIIVNRVEVELTGKQKEAYDSMQQDFFVNFEELTEEDLEIGAPNIISQIIRLKQIAVSERLLSFEKDLDGSAKLEAILDILEESEDRKVIIGSQFKEFLDRLGPILTKNHIPYEFVHGSIGEIKGNNAIESFKQNPHVKVLMGTIKSLGFGIDGLQDVCNDIILVDLEWNNATNNQFVGRIHRNGQKHKTLINIIEAKNTIEQWIQSKLKWKDGMVNETIPVRRIGDYIKESRNKH